MDNSFFYPIHDIILDTSGRGVIVGKNGSLTYVVKLHLPEVYSLYKTELEVRHSAFTTAFSKMPDNSYVHKQDVFWQESIKLPMRLLHIWERRIRNILQGGNTFLILV